VLDVALTRLAETQIAYGPRVAAGSDGLWASATPVGLTVRRGDDVLWTVDSPGGLLGELRFGHDGSVLAAPHVFDPSAGEWEALAPLAPLLAADLGPPPAGGYAAHASCWDPDGQRLVVVAEYTPPRRLGSPPATGVPAVRLLLFGGRGRWLEHVLREGPGSDEYRALAAGDDVVMAGARRIGVWDGSGAPVADLDGHDAPVRALRVAADGVIASLAADGALALWKVGYGRIAGWRAHEGDARALDLHPGGELVASGGDDGFLRLWSRQGERVAELVLGAPVEGLAFTPQGSELLAAQGPPGERLLRLAVG
jgi:hypothetical protein